MEEAAFSLVLINIIIPKEKDSVDVGQFRPICLCVEGNIFLEGCKE